MHIRLAGTSCRMRKSRKSSNVRAGNPEGTNLKRPPYSTMEVHEAIGVVLVPRAEERSPDRVRVQSLVHLREMQEQQFQQLHAVHDIFRTRGAPEDERRLIVDNWTQQISHARQPIINLRTEEIVDS